MKSRLMIPFVAAASFAAVPSPAQPRIVPAAPPPAAAPAAGVAPAPAAPATPPMSGAVPTTVAPIPANPQVPASPSLGGITERQLPNSAEPGVEGLDPEPGGLTADEVARRALAVSPAVKAKHAQVEAANEKIKQTMSQFFPKLTLLASYTRLSNVNASFPGAIVGAQSAGGLSVGPCPGGTGQCVLDSGNQPIGASAFTIPVVVDNYSVSARLAIPISDYILRITNAAASSKAGSQSAKFSEQAEKLRVETDARTLYFNWLRARAQAVIARKSVERTRARLEDAKSSFAVGAISKADLLKIEALVANTEIVLDRSETLVSLTTGQLAIVMEDWHPAYRVGEGIPQAATVAPPDATVDRLIAEAHSRRLEVRAMDENVRALSKGASATRAGVLPRIDAVGDVTYANPNPRYFPPTKEWHPTWSVGAQATWNIADAYGNAAAARELDAEAKAAEAQRTLVRAGIAQEVLGAYLDSSRARAALEKQQVALAAAEEGYRVTTDLFKAGRATSTELIESETQLLEAKFGNVNSQIDLAVAAIALKHATGRDVATGPASAKN